MNIKNIQMEAILQVSVGCFLVFAIYETPVKMSVHTTSRRNPQKCFLCYYEGITCVQNPESQFVEIRVIKRVTAIRGLTLVFIIICNVAALFAQFVDYTENIVFTEIFIFHLLLDEDRD